MNAEHERKREIREIISLDPIRGRVLVSFASLEQNILLPMYDMSFACQGIDAEVGGSFSATLNSGAGTLGLMRIGDLAACEQLKANSMPGSLTA